MLQELLETSERFSEPLPFWRCSSTLMAHGLAIIAITHISYTTLIVEELICVMRVYLWCLLVLPL